MAQKSECYGGHCGIKKCTDETVRLDKIKLMISLHHILICGQID